jgi:hypothetical protein
MPPSPYGPLPGVGRRGTVPRFSGDQARQAVEDDAKDRLIGGARRQVDLDEAQPQSVELHDAPGRAFGHQPAHRPEEPIGTSVKEEAELVGGGLMTGCAVGGEMVLPRLDVVLRSHVRDHAPRPLRSPPSRPACSFLPSDHQSGLRF